MLGLLFEAFNAVTAGNAGDYPFPSWPLPSIDTVLKAFKVEDFARPEFQSALMAKVALEAEKANVDQAAAEEAIAALHLEEIALGALFILARILLFACTGALHSLHC